MVDPFILLHFHICLLMFTSTNTNILLAKNQKSFINEKFSGKNIRLLQ